MGWSSAVCSSELAPGPPPVLTEIRWDILPPDGKQGGRQGEGPRLRVRSEASSSDFALDGSRPEMAGALRTLGEGKGPVAFRIAHAAGTLDCDGRLTRRYEGKGDCRFTGDPGFEGQLAARGLAPDGPREIGRANV